MGDRGGVGFAVVDGDAVAMIGGVEVNLHERYHSVLTHIRYFPIYSVGYLL